MPFANTKDILRSFAAEVIRQARLELGVVKKRKGIRATWTKDGQPKSHRTRTFKGRINSSGTLSRSLEFNEDTGTDGAVVRFLMEAYGIYVDQGRKPGKFAPVKSIERYTKAKKMRPRNLTTGQFIANSGANRRNMNFLINRKLKNFGTEKTEFFTKPLNRELAKLPPELQDALIKDILIQFKNI